MATPNLTPCEDILGGIPQPKLRDNSAKNDSSSVLAELKEFEEETSGVRKRSKKKRSSNNAVIADPSGATSRSSKKSSRKHRSSKHRSSKSQKSSSMKRPKSEKSRSITKSKSLTLPSATSTSRNGTNSPSPGTPTGVSSSTPRSRSPEQNDDDTICEEDIHRGEITGEKLLMKLEIKYLNPTYNVAIQGNLVMTNYQLFFEPSTHARLPVGDHNNVYVPLASIDRIEQTGNERNDRSVYALDIYTRQYRQFRFLFARGGGVRARAYQLLMQYAFPPQLSLVFAFSHLQERVFSRENDGWKLYDPAKEFRRMGIPNSRYRLTAINAEYHLCPTYPRLIVVPQSFPDETLWKVAEFRKRGRIPVLTWKHPASQAAIWRCSQPRVGVSSTRCLEDEELLKIINLTNPDNDTLYIMDARPKLNAVGNRVAGAGYELIQHYGQCTIRFLNIENIHTMREALQRLGKLLNRHKPNDLDFFSQLESSNHLAHIRELLHATFDMVSVIDRSKASIVSHCSDGWDRTTQLCSLTELCMDPYFRTMDGLFVLIEKEWLSYGHQFQTRTGHGDRDYNDDQRAPIFHQFIEAVWNLTEQFPLAFEFTSKMLVSLLDHLYSCRFGTFLYDSEQNRRKAKLAQSTVSLWTYLKLSQHQDLYQNPLYDPQFCGPVLYPTYSAKKIQLWGDYFLRWYDHESLHGGIGNGSVPPYGSSAATLLSKDMIIHIAVRKKQQRIDELEAILRRMESERHRLQTTLKSNGTYELTELEDTIDQSRGDDHDHDQESLIENKVNHPDDIAKPDESEQNKEDREIEGSVQTSKEKKDKPKTISEDGDSTMPRSLNREQKRNSKKAVRLGDYSASALDQLIANGDYFSASSSHAPPTETPEPVAALYLLESERVAKLDSGGGFESTFVNGVAASPAASTTPNVQ